MARVLNAAMGSAPPDDYVNEDADADLMDVGILRLWRERVPEFKTQWPDMGLRYRNGRGTRRRGRRAIRRAGAG